MFKPFTVLRIDDILISGENDSEYFHNLERILGIVRKCGLRLKKEKCVFIASEIACLGIRINKNEVNTLPEKVADLLNAKAAKNTTQLKSFLGMLNYYHRQLPNLAHNLEPLHNSKWNWGREQKHSFEKIKVVLCSPKLLIHCDLKKPLVLACGVSHYGLGAVLSHQNR